LVLSPPDKERCRAGLLSLILLPWLISAFNGWKQRLIATLGFVVIFTAQLAPLSINGVGARFAIIPVAAFCGLFAARATKSPIITCCLLLFVSFQSLRHIPGLGYLQGGQVRYNPNHENNKELYPIVKDDLILLVGRALSQDARISGALGQIKFKYIRCAANNDWDALMTQAKDLSKWIFFSNEGRSLSVGPGFRTALGPACPDMPLTEFKDILHRTGWFPHKVFYSSELWTHQ
jgi:hypothetical protein